jgi:hypothetical protein
MASPLESSVSAVVDVTPDKSAMRARRAATCVGCLRSIQSAPLDEKAIADVDGISMRSNAPSKRFNVEWDCGPSVRIHGAPSGAMWISLTTLPAIDLESAGLCRNVATRLCPLSSRNRPRSVPTQRVPSAPSASAEIAGAWAAASAAPTARAQTRVA